jgi:peptide/nickel transport system permease protein
MSVGDAARSDAGPRSGRLVAESSAPRSFAVPILVASLLTIVLVCFGLPALVPLPSPVGGDVLEANLPPFSPGHFLGTDLNGNDVLSRMLHGGRVSIVIALAVNSIGFLLGGTIGAVSGYVGRTVDALIMRTLDVFIAFPSLVLVLAVAQGLGGGILNTIWALSFFSIPAFARVARAAALRVREQAFVTAAPCFGISRPTSPRNFSPSPFWASEW